MTDIVTDPNELVIDARYVLPSTADVGSTETRAFGAGEVDVDITTGAPVQFRDLTSPERLYLLEQKDVFWHSLEHQWGSGHLITNRGSARWNVPLGIEVDETGSRSDHAPLDGVRLTVTRSFGPIITEHFQFHNDGPDELRITGLGVQTPFADLYQGARASLDRAVHAHLFTGGATAWALAQPMSGTGRLLGVILRQGELRSYSVESRNKNTLSNARGHLVLQATDFTRNPTAFGGQPEIVLAPGESYALSWDIAWFDNIEQLMEAVAAPVHFAAYSAEVGTTIALRTDSAPVIPDGVSASVTAVDGGYEITSSTHGPIDIEVGGMRTEIAFHLPLADVARRRIEYILDHQTTPERPGLLAHAFVPVDTRNKLTQSTNGWSDWSDGSERIGMPVLIQLAAMAGWVPYDHEVASALDGWAQFAQAHLLDATAAPRRGSQFQHSGPRLYDAPWLAQFFHDRYHFLGDRSDLDLAARIIERAFELGGSRHLSIQFSETCTAIARSLDDANLGARAQTLRTALVASARAFIAMGVDLPGHEVSYEQSMVAPLINLLIDAFTITGETEFLAAIEERLPWLLAFGGPQPHVRLNGIGIRHWDGYWFGSDQLWGDIFPHYWSALTATVLLRLPAPLRSERTDELAGTILRANMLNYNADGSATCAFVMPSSVDGRAGNAADPLANDQDWHLSIWMRALGLERN